jgi:LAS superfamily LD-carboxypeptidase LdcB
MDMKEVSSSTPHPERITSIYKWMMLNAHLYGFIRGVDTERWHWEYEGAGSSQFAKVPRNHPSWDEFFINGEGVDTL